MKAHYYGLPCFRCGHVATGGVADPMDGRTTECLDLDACLKRVGDSKLYPEGREKYHPNGALKRSKKGRK